MTTAQTPPSPTDLRHLLRTLRDNGGESSSFSSKEVNATLTKALEELLQDLQTLLAIAKTSSTINNPTTPSNESDDHVLLDDRSNNESVRGVCSVALLKKADQLLVGASQLRSALGLLHSAASATSKATLWLNSSTKTKSPAATWTPMKKSASAGDFRRLCTKAFDPLEPTHPEEHDGNFAEEALTPHHPSVWSGFYNKTLRERFDVLTLMYPRLGRKKTMEHHQEPAAPPPEALDPLAKLGELPMRTANLMIENCVGVLGIPLGLGLNFVIDGRHLSVPMAVEEPSVVAAASSAAKLVSTHAGGFHTATSGNVMTSQVQLVDTPDFEAAIDAVEFHKEDLLKFANATLCPNMYKRGGGAIDIYCRIVSKADKVQRTRHDEGGWWYTDAANAEKLPFAQDNEVVVKGDAPDQATFLVVHIDVNVCEAMGANIVNTVAEGLSSELARITNSRCGLRILTNLCMQRRACASFDIPVRKLGWKGVDGEVVAERILEAYHFAEVDPYRAVTHNKGIMNGVDAVAIATGQDWRAIEAAAHCFASRSGQYTSLSKYEVISKPVGPNGEQERFLRGSLELPISIGSKGGALQTHPGYASTHAILNQPNARTLSGIMVSVGLAQNFAAIRALAITGIQSGHMALHARNIAVAAGAPSELVSELCVYMLGRKSINVETAKEYLQAHAVFSEIHSGDTPPTSPTPMSLPSMFYVEIAVPGMARNISINLAFPTVNKTPLYISITPPSTDSNNDKNNQSNNQSTRIQHQLLGDKGYNQLQKMLLLLSSMKLIFQEETNLTLVESGNPLEQEKHAARANLELQTKLELLSILINIVAYRLLEMGSPTVKSFMQRVLELGDTTTADAKKYRDLLSEVPRNDDVLSTGLPLFLALWQALHYHIDQDVPATLLQKGLLKQQWLLLHSIVKSFELNRKAQIQDGPDRQAMPTEDQMIAYMAVHAKRWQATMLLLIHSLALGAEALTKEQLEFLHRIGEYIEWEGTLAHDIARYPRSIKENEPNAFVFWLLLHHQPHETLCELAIDQDQLEAFRQMMEQIARKKWTQLVHQKEQLSSHSFGLTAVERVVQLVWDVYDKRPMALSRKESF